MNLCCNCEYLLAVRSRPEAADNWKCGHEQAVLGIDCLTGDKILYKCRDMRGIGPCGVDGKLFKLYEKPADVYKHKAYGFSSKTGKVGVIADGDSLLDELSNL